MPHRSGRYLRLDRRDVQIMELLSSDGRITNAELSNRVALSPSACLERVRKLEESGVVAGYRAHIDYDKLAPYLMAHWDILLPSPTEDNFRVVGDTLLEMPEVLTAHRVSGQYQLLVWLMCRDAAHLDLALDRFVRQVGPIATVHVRIVLKTVRGLGNYDLRQLVDAADDSGIYRTIDLRPGHAG